MFVGHFAVAFLLWRLFPQVPLPVILIAVSFPDLLWSILVPAGVEKVRINPDSPLQKFVVFEKFPYSHSLVLGSVLSLPVGLLVAGLLNNPLVIPVFVAGSASHWLLDTVVHLKDLPVLGFDGDRKVGAGLWRRGPVAFVVERSEEHTSELQSRPHLVCRLLLEKKKTEPPYVDPTTAVACAAVA